MEPDSHDDTSTVQQTGRHYTDRSSSADPTADHSTTTGTGHDSNLWLLTWMPALYLSRSLGSR
jgi:hypothetical protein